MKACTSETLELQQVHYIGWGEPLLHPQFGALVDIVKSDFPAALQMATTAGNVCFEAAVGAAPLDNLIVSCDGARQESYEKYRRGGNFADVQRFMQQAKRAGRKDLHVEWKYILFEFNDSDDEILAAQTIAEDLGIDSLLFIVTNSKWRSRRYGVNNILSLPLRSKIASVAPAAAMDTIFLDGKVEIPSPPKDKGMIGYIDKCWISAGKFLTIEGWALDESGKYIEQIELLIEGEVRARTRTTQRRVDVLRAFPHAEGSKSGFMFRLPVDPANPPELIELRVAQGHEQSAFGGHVRWVGHGSQIKQRKDLPTYSNSATA